MQPFWKRDREFSDLEAELRARRAEPPIQFVRALAGRPGGERSWVRPRARVALVVALVILAAAAVASAGGVGLAASGTGQVVQVLADLTGSSSSQTTVAASPADNQYKNKCGKPPREKCHIEISDSKVREGNASTTPMVFTVTMNSQSDQTITVHFTTVNGTAIGGSACTAGIDYVTQTGTVTFLPGDTMKTITILVCGDTKKEPDETFTVLLSNPQPADSAVIGGHNPGTGTIVNDDK
jgi:Calx-beta domain